MYKLVIQLHDLNLQNSNQIVHEVISPHYRSIQECFERMETGIELFDSYLAIDEYVRKERERILSNIENLTKET
jgi:hypothetical protein